MNSEQQRIEAARIAVSKMWPHASDGMHRAVARAALAAADAVAGAGWQPIETAPKDGQSFIAYVPQNKCTYIIVWNKEEPGWDIFGGTRRSYLTEGGPTHWQPLPEPPHE